MPYKKPLMPRFSSLAAAMWGSSGSTAAGRQGGWEWMQGILGPGGANRTCVISWRVDH